jgi:hypothetical protein
MEERRTFLKAGTEDVAAVGEGVGESEGLVDLQE